MAKKPKHINRLINEKSPYLLQHAHNPVNWYPWGNEAFTAAKDANKPIFLSIGYATCHWCHTMEMESFEDPEIARLLNETFINIKVDREELPEVDNLYMEFAQSMMAGAAGWPLNVILTPNLQPFFAATYLPPREQQGMMGLEDLILRIHEVWESDERDRVVSQAEKIVEVFQDSIHVIGQTLPPKEIIDSSLEMLYKLADPVYGGMRGAPKFPIPYQSMLLMDYSFLKNDSRALFLSEKTLDMMQRGGICDHLGGGFSRYSVDERWLVPHFEKMLYDNAMLAEAYLNAWKLTRKSAFQETCDAIIQYVLRDMTHPDGGFYSAEDADSEGREGLFYTWSKKEIENILGDKESALFCDFFDVTEEGNFEGRNILHLKLREDEFCAKKGLDPLAFGNALSAMKDRLWTARENKVHPLKDDKILSSWNGLMIHSLVMAGAAMGCDAYVEAAEKAARFIYDHLWVDGALLRRWREGEAQFAAGLDEYAFMIRGLLTLFEAGRGARWLKWALNMTNQLEFSYKEEKGGFYQTDGLDPFLILRKSQFSDGAEPSGNAVHCENLLRLYRLSGDPKYLRQAEDILKAVEKYIRTYPPGYTFHLRNLIRYYNRQIPTIVVALNDQKDFYKDIYQKVFSLFQPHRAVIWKFPHESEVGDLLPFAKGQVVMDGKTTLYICRDRVCDRPLTDIQEIMDALEAL